MIKRLSRQTSSKTIARSRAGDGQHRTPTKQADRQDVLGPSGEPKWRANRLQVQAALEFIKHKGAITAGQLVEWDDRHGRQLFTWDDGEAARLRRADEARRFLNRFRIFLNGVRVRAFINVHLDENGAVSDGAYYPVEVIAESPPLRARVIEDLTRRLASVAKELKMWRLDRAEQQGLFRRLRKAMEA